MGLNCLEICIIFINENSIYSDTQKWNNFFFKNKFEESKSWGPLRPQRHLWPKSRVHYTATREAAPTCCTIYFQIVSKSNTQVVARFIIYSFVYFGIESQRGRRCNVNHLNEHMSDEKKKRAKSLDGTLIK